MNYESTIKHYFETLGYHVEKIPEGKLKSPDYLITDNHSIFILELKTKFPRPEEIRNRDQVLTSGKIFKIDEEIERKNILSGIIRKAGKQLHQSDEKNYIRIVWLSSTDYLAELRMEQFVASLYGLTTIVYTQEKDKATVCYFFHNSDFFMNRFSIDGAIVSTESQAKLLLNPLSPRYQNLKQSSLPQHFANDLVDPIELEKAGKAFIVDSDINRSDIDSLLHYLCEKYKIENAKNLPMHFLSGTKTIPDTLGRSY